jgi:hypothetical protein
MPHAPLLHWAVQHSAAVMQASPSGLHMAAPHTPFVH